MDDGTTKNEPKSVIHRDIETEFDAVHPRFVVQKTPDEALLQYQNEHYYYCEACNLYLAPTVPALRQHFDNNRDMERHTPCGSCVYCRGEVFQYKLNDRLRLYHNCP